MEDLGKQAVRKAVYYLVSKAMNGAVAVYNDEQAVDGRMYLQSLRVVREKELKKQNKAFPRVIFKLINEDQRAHTSVGSVLSTL